MAELLHAEGKVALVFGAAGGIGSAIVQQYRRSGGLVMGADLASPRGISDDDLSVCDAADEAAVSETIARTLSRYGRLDAVVHCVGVACGGPLADMDLADWSRVMDINLTSAFLVAKHAHAALKATKGSLVFIGSSSGRNGGTTPSGPAYAASKAGMLNLARYLAREWAPEIRVNCVAPGPVMTPMMEAAGRERQTAYAAAMLTGRLAGADEIAACVAFLVSEHGRSMTGAVLNPSGGLFLD